MLLLAGDTLALVLRGTDFFALNVAVFLQAPPTNLYGRVDGKLAVLNEAVLYVVVFTLLLLCS
jgi:hypothetical protein